MTTIATPIADRVHVFGRVVEYKWIVVGVVVSSLFLDILDVTIVNVALPAMGQQLHSDAVEWVVLAYTLALAVSIPAAGWWSDRIGTKRAFLVSLTLFIGFSVMCGMAQSMGQLILFRVFQGIGGGMLTPIAMAMLFRAFLPSERAKASTAVMIPTMLAPALGPIIGGILVTQVGWRWIFWVNFPVGLVAFAFGWKYLREHKEPTAGRFDLPGFLLSAVGLSFSIYALSEGPRAGWTSTVVVSSAVIGIVGIIAFVVVELRVHKPMLDVRLLANRMFRNANVTMGLSMAAFVGFLFILPLYLQNLRGYSAMRSGLATFPQALGVLCSTLVASRLYMRIGPRRLIAAGLWASGLVMIGFQWFDLHTSLWWLRLLMFTRGLAAGLSFMPIQASAYATITPADTGRASSIFATSRQVAISVGVATLATILSNYGPLAGPPADVEESLRGYHIAALTATCFALAAGTFAFFFIRDEDAAGTMHPRK